MTHACAAGVDVGRDFFDVGLAPSGQVFRTANGPGGVLALAPILWAMRPVEMPGPGQGIVVYQKNLLHSVDDPARIAADIRDSGADVALLQELSAQNGELTGMLADVLPHQAVCPSNTPERIRTSSGSFRCVVNFEVPGFRLSSQGCKSASLRLTPGGQPSTVQPMAGPWLSPQVVTRKR